MSATVMNSGWEQHPYGFPEISVGTRRDFAEAVWPNSAIKSILGYASWFESEFHRMPTHPFMTRGEGVLNLGGTFDLVVFDWVGISSAELQGRMMQLAADSAHLKDESVLHLRIHSGNFYETSRLHAELFNPLTLRRELMGVDEFRDFVQELNRIVTSVLDDPAQAEAREQLWRRFGERDRVLAYLSSSALGLAQFFQRKRIALDTIVHLLINLNTYTQVHTCLKELPDDGSAAQLSAYRLATLYG